MATSSTAHHRIRHRWMETLLNEKVSDGGISVTHNSTIIIDAATQPPLSLSSTSSSSNSSASLTVLGSLIIVGLFIILGLSVWYITWCTLRYYRQKKLRRDILLMRAAHLSGASGHDVRNDENQPWYVDDTPTLERIQRRYETVEHWTITKRAQEHTACCSTIQAQRCCITNTTGTLSSHTGGAGTKSETESPCVSSIIIDEEMDHSHIESDMEVERECPICMSKLEADQILSWSSNPKCIHGTLNMKALRKLESSRSFYDVVSLIISTNSLLHPQFTIMNA
jgi:hypothetical protein